MLTIRPINPVSGKSLHRHLKILLFFVPLLTSCEPAERHADPTLSAHVQETTSIRVVRAHDGRLVNKLLISEADVEPARFSLLKGSVNQLLESFKSQQVIASASVYFLDLKTGDWFSINPSEGYKMGSLLKLPVSMTFLKKSEADPRLMDHLVFCDASAASVPQQTFEIEPLQPGKTYPTSELLKRVLKYSDNVSTNLMNRNLDLAMLDKLYSDLDQSTPDMLDKSYVSNVVDFSRFFNVLYNGTWLNERNSELVLGWLSESSFKEGLVKQIPENVVVARKFGEFGTPQEKQWHESGVVYAENGHYLITVMTRGNDAEKLRYAISEISKLVYEGRK